MCGIAGVLRPRADQGRQLVDDMLGRLAHRGPDDIGSIALGTTCIGMRRLSILDPTPAGHQPMSSSDGRFTIVYNGEVYNFLELADELEARGHRFTTRTDTEVILAAYAAWGPRCVRRFNGIWAFAIWDSTEETLLLSRDRVGVKPLFIADAPDGGLAFASEIKAIRTLPWISSEPRADVMRDYLIDGTHDHSTKTFFRLIDALPAAHTMLVHRDGRRTVER